jgi:hypothetical protein
VTNVIFNRNPPCVDFLGPENRALPDRFGIQKVRERSAGLVQSWLPAGRHHWIVLNPALKIEDRNYNSWTRRRQSIPCRAEVAASGIGRNSPET